MATASDGPGTATAGDAGVDADDGLDGMSDDTDPAFDVGGMPDAPHQPESPCGEATQALSHIWIANTVENTLSKINTETLEEEGRYRTHGSSGSPSRTSVNLNGDAAVVNRNGGVVAFRASLDHCMDADGDGAITTSSGSGDVLPFEQDECMMWSTPMNCDSSRPAAWTTGVLDEASCTYEDVAFWTVCDQEILLLDGETGVIEQTLPMGTLGTFAYGGAADADGNFWIIDTHGSRQIDPWDGGVLVRADYETLDVSHYPLHADGAYGITVDGEGRPFTCRATAVRFNLDDASWSEGSAHSGGGGCMYDGAGRVWHSGYGAEWGLGTIFGFNVDTLQLEVELDIPEYAHGISIDADGYVWGVTRNGSNAYKIDPNTGSFEVFGGLDGAYTYSDMTGVGLVHAGGGQVPAG